MLRALNRNSLSRWFTRHRIALASILFLAAVLRFYQIDFQSIWVDEILTMKETNPARSITQLYDDILFWEQMPHLYFFIVHFAFKIFGFTVIVGRSFSAICGIFAVFGVYLLGKELYNRQAGLVSAAVLALSGFHIAYSQEMRPYAMFFLFTILSMYRLVLFIKDPTRRNAIYYGVFTGLIIHGHMFGLVTIFAQGIVLLTILLLENADSRKPFLQKCILAALVTLAVIAPGFQAVIHVLTFKSFWLAPPTATVYSDLFRDLLNGSEIVVYLVQVFVLVFILATFRRRSGNTASQVLGDRLVFSAIVIAIWTVITLLLPLLKSHLDVSMIISRYFISLVAVLALVVGITSQLIATRTVRITAVLALLVFMFVDLTAVRKYYSTVTKSQVAELTHELSVKNPDKHKIVTFWSWLLPHFFIDDPAMQVDPVSQSLDQYVEKLRTGAQSEGGFWYANANSRPFTISAENANFLASRYDLKHDLQYHDAWAKHYVPKNTAPAKKEGLLDLADFGRVGPDGKMILYDEALLKSTVIALTPGRYRLSVQGSSMPEVPLNGEHAHITVKWNSTTIGEGNFESARASSLDFDIVIRSAEKGFFTIHYDNDFFQDGKDRNAVLLYVSLVPIKNQP